MMNIGLNNFHGLQACKHGKGFTLIEILVTMFILAIGLLGLAGLTTEGMKNNQGAYLRTQASILAYDMVDRIRANKDQAAGYQGFSTVGAATKLPSCVSSTSGCTAADRVTADLVEWTRQIQGVGSGVAMLPGGQGRIMFDGTGLIYTITIQWQETGREGDAGEVVAGDNSYTVRFTL